MTTELIDRTLVRDACFAADLDPDEGGLLRDDYSGRGMLGAQCFGFVTPLASDAYRILLHLLVFMSVDGDHDPSVAIELVDELIRNARQDNMGMDVIVYFPGYALTPEDDE